MTPAFNFANTLAIPDLHRWYFYDNDRYRPGVFARFDFDDHGMFHAHLDGGWFQFINNERRNDQSLGRYSDPTILTPTTGTFSGGAGLLDYDKYVQNREIEYVEIGGGMNFADDMHLDATFNYSIGHYAQTTAQDHVRDSGRLPRQWPRNAWPSATIWPRRPRRSSRRTISRRS